MPFQRSEVEPFRCEIEPRRDAVHVHLVGELDLATTPIVEEKLTDLVGVGFARLVLDLRELQFLDSTGLQLILAWHDKARANGWSFSLVDGPAPVQRLFELTGTRSHLHFLDPGHPADPGVLSAVA